MKTEMQTFNLNGIIPFSAQVERGIGFVYALKFQRNTQDLDVVSIIKIPAGRYIDDKLQPFFQFKSQTNKIVYPFEINYPHKNSNDTFINIYFITKTSDQDTVLYYNVKNKWVSDKYKASFFFSQNNAQKIIDDPNFTTTSTTEISYFKAECNQIVSDGIEFPVSSYFSLSDVTDYSDSITDVITISIQADRKEDLSVGQKLIKLENTYIPINDTNSANFDVFMIINEDNTLKAQKIINDTTNNTPTLSEDKLLVSDLTIKSFKSLN